MSGTIPIGAVFAAHSPGRFSATMLPPGGPQTCMDTAVRDHQQCPGCGFLIGIRAIVALEGKCLTYFKIIA